MPPLRDEKSAAAVLLAPEISSKPPRFSPRRILLWAMLVGLAVRLAAMPFTFSDLRDPGRNYFRFGWESGQVAAAVASGHGYSSPLPTPTGPSAWLPPVFPLLLAGMFRAFGIFSAASAFVILLLNSIFSVLTCIPVYFIARHSFGEPAAKFAAWGWSLFPYAVYYSVGRVWSDCLGALLFALAFLTALRLGEESRLRDWLTWGALWGLLALTNPAVLAALPFLLGWIVVRSHPRVTYLLLMLFVAFVVVGPWMIRNYRVFHRVIPLRDNFWMEMRFGNTGDLSEIIPDWAHPSTNAQEQAEFARLGELAYNQEKKQLVTEFVKQHPTQFAGLCLRRISNFWTGYWSLNREFLEAEPFTYPNMVFVTGTSVITFFGLWMAWRRRLPVAPYVLVLIFFPLVYYLTHSELEYRHPIEPLMVALAAFGASVIFRGRHSSLQTESASFT